MESCLILAASVAEPTLLETVWSWVWMILSVGAGLGFVIFVHELGHFLVAKACGVKCEKFYIGFDFFELNFGSIPVPGFLTKLGLPARIPLKIPRALCKFHYGETEYGVGILPLGGYVKMLGQDDDPRNAEAEAARIRSFQEGTAAEGMAPGQTVEKAQLDPRSLPAKSVPARAAIFAAGVAMNLIFGVILGAMAYKIGVAEVPAIIGSTTPGGPAWQQNIRPGSRIIQLGNSAPYDHIRWEDLTRDVILAGFKGKVSFTVKTPDGQTIPFELQPSDRLKAIAKRPTLGVIGQLSREVRVQPEAAAFLGPKVSAPLEERDLLVAIEGQRLAADHEVNELLAKHPSGPLKITIARTDKPAKGATELAKPREIELTVDPKPMRDLGLVMRAGPIVAIREDSPALEAGFQVGDVLQKVNGEPIGDPLSLGQRLAPASEPAEPITFTVERQGADGKPTSKELTVTPVLVEQFHESYPLGGPTAIESVGIAFDVTNVVEGVVSESPAAQAGMKPGDKITQADFVPANEADKKAEAGILGKEGLEPIVLDNTVKTWTFVFTRMQLSLPTTRVKLTFDRGGKTQSADLTPVDSTDFFDESRGLAFYGQQVKHQAKDWGAAFSLGLRETKERLIEVLRVLGSLVTGKLSPTMLSGPLGILYVAKEFANEGLSRLLLFLTMLSANLVVLNLLPIPALDGGHLLFLAAEAIRGKPVDERLQMRLTIAGVICLLGLMVFATLMDLDRFFL